MEKLISTEKYLEMKRDKKLYYSMILLLSDNFETFIPMVYSGYGSDVVF